LDISANARKKAICTAQSAKKLGDSSGERAPLERRLRGPVQE